MSLPEIKDIKDLSEGLLGRDVATSTGDPVDPSVTPGPMCAEYVDPSNHLCAVVLMDFPLSAYVGAALGLVPAGGAEAAIEDGELPASLQENTAEFLNVLAAPLGDAAPVHHRLNRTYAPDDELPADVASWAASAAMRRDLELDVKGYGKGHLSIISTAV